MKQQNRYSPLNSFLVLLCVMLCAAAAGGQSKTASPVSALKYRNPNLTVDERVADLLPRMTLEEKVEQISGGGRGQVELIDPTGTFTTEQARETLGRWWDPDLVFPPKRAAILRNGIQRYLLEKTRLGIPDLFMGEALHGFMEYGSTSFQQALGLASTWDPELVHQVFTAAGDEAGSSGAGQVLSPVLDIARDPRWGRTEETYGEDPFLAARMGVAAITGLQGDSFMIGRHHVVATAKHFAVHGQPEGGTNTAPANYSERIIRENFLVPFQAAGDSMQGGKSTASIQVVDGGANNSKGALRITGEVIPGAAFTWAGALFAPGSSPEDLVNLSSKQAISFWAKGDGKTYVLAVRTLSRQNEMPGIKTFVAGPDWQQYSFPISSFNTDGQDVLTLAFVQSVVGKFEFEIDQVEIK